MRIFFLAMAVVAVLAGVVALWVTWRPDQRAGGVFAAVAAGLFVMLFVSAAISSS